MKVRDLFIVKYGVNLELTALETIPANEKDSVNFVARSAENNGVVARVRKIDAIEPQPAGILSCAGGGSVLSTFVQTGPFYSGRDLYTLTPKRAMALPEKLYWCMCIKANAYRYTYGRQANKTLKDIELPDTVPEWVHATSIMPIKTTATAKVLSPLSADKWSNFALSSIFAIERGKRLKKENRLPGNIPLVTAGMFQEGVSEYIDREETPNKLYRDRVTVDMFGNAFYHNYDFFCDDNILVLNSAEKISKYALLFIVTLLNADKYRYSYGKQYRQKDFKNHIIKLPATPQGSPDWGCMEQYIKSLPYGDRI
jgi:hypothetical protein